MATKPTGTSALEKRIDLPVTFVDLMAGEQAPRFAAYQLDASGRPLRKLGSFDGKTLTIELAKVDSVSFGPDVDTFKSLSPDSLATYRIKQTIDLWRQQGVVLPRDIWDRFHFHFTCVTGTARKCRPWYWDLIDDIRLAPMFERTQLARIKPITAELQQHILFPLSCQPLCDGVVEIFERVCCCHHIHIPDLLGRLRDILDSLPIPLPDPIPDPIPGPDPAPFDTGLLRARTRAIRQRKAPLDLAAIPPENLHRDYLALRAMPLDAAQRYVLDRPYLFPIFCHCSARKVGQTSLQSGGHFDFCYPSYRPPLHGHCSRSYAYKIRQLINGVWTVVYDGLAAHQYFSAGTAADIRSFSPAAHVCADGPGNPPPNDGQPFVMLEHVGSYGSFHFNFPVQTGVSQMAMLDANDGTITTAYAPDCPWGSALGLRLWFSPELEPIVKYYRLKVFAIDDAGAPVGAPRVLNDTVTWDKFVDIPGDVIRAPETLGPMPVGAEADLFKVPYWSSPDHRYLSGQFHQVWNTALPGRFPDGKYMLVIEVFDAAGNRIKPNGAAGMGTAKNFQFLRWTSAVDTDPVPFADAAHVFWVDNTPVGGDLIDLRQSGIVNSAECQFMSGTASSTFAIGFSAFHKNGVDHAGNGDDNSFMWHYNITWQRGLNGASGTLGFAPSGGTNHTDVGETGGAVASGSLTFADLLDGLPKCSFSVTLRIYAKHFTGSSRIQGYDYQETASFALEIGGA